MAAPRNNEKRKSPAYTRERTQRKSSHSRSQSATKNSKLSTKASQSLQKSKLKSVSIKRSGISLKQKRSTCKKLVGAHVSIAGGLHKAVQEAVRIGATSFGLFLKSQRQWAAKPLNDTTAEKFKDACKEFGFGPSQILPHGSYLVNCGSSKPDLLKKSRAALIDELKRCEQLGINLYNFHPGSTCGEISVEKCISNIAKSINMAHAKTKKVITVIENMCCQGNTIGGKFEELRAIINKVKNKSRVGVCLDTCHAFAAGFDLSTPAGYKKFISDFGRIVGFKYLKAVHLNDSIGDLGCHLDRHENIGQGKIGREGFRRVMNDKHFNNIPMILETPGDFGYDREIKILHRLSKH